MKRVGTLTSVSYTHLRQKRVGRIGADGKPREFTMLKFRSMVKGADKMKDALLAENEVEMCIRDRLRGGR